MDIVNPAIDLYLHELANPADPVLREMELLAAERSFPIVGPQVGQLLGVLAASVSAERVIELGSGFGYSAYWFARAVGPGGQVIRWRPRLARSSSAAASRTASGSRSATPCRSSTPSVASSTSCSTTSTRTVTRSSWTEPPRPCGPADC
jgi:hypothetical protein